MSHSMSIKNILLIFSFLLLALPGCYFGGGGVFFRLSCLTLIVVLCYAFFKYPKLVTSSFVKCSKKKTTLLLILLFFWFLIGALICSHMGLCNINKFTYAFITRFIPLVIIPYYMGFFVAQNFSNKQIIKFFYFLFLFVVVIGGLDIIFNLLHFPILQYTISNHRTFINGTLTKGTYLDLNRVQSVFDEPGFLGRFVCIYLFFIYSVSESRIRIFKNHATNYTVKKCTPFLTWINLIFAMSPMFISLATIQTLFYKFILKVHQKKRQIINLIIFILIIYTLFVIFSVFSFSGTFLDRIHNTVVSLTGIEKLVARSGSLANRIENYYGLILVFLKHPLTGVGFGCALPHLYNEFLNMTIPLTLEIKRNLQAINPTGMNHAILWVTLAENGIIGFLLLYGIFFRVIYKTIKKIKKVTIQNQKFLRIILSSVIMMVLLSVYDSGISSDYMWFTLGVLVGYKPDLSTNEEL